MNIGIAEAFPAFGFGRMVMGTINSAAKEGDVYSRPVCFLMVFEIHI